MSTPLATPLDTRERILLQLQACLKTLRPGVVFPLPFGKTHRAIQTDLGGRVFNRVRPLASFSEGDMPCVELVTSSGTEDAVREAADDDFYLTDLNVELWGYVYAGDSGDGPDAPVRRALNALRADLIVAVEAFPFWYDGDEWPEPAARSCGVITPVLVSTFTEPATATPDGYLKLDYRLAYTFNRFDP